MPNLEGLHHITAISGEPARTIAFYTKVLGLRLVKLTVNFDDPRAYHLYFGDEKGTPGTLITFFDWSESISPGRIGAGVVDHIAWKVPNRPTLLAWREHLARRGVQNLEFAGKRSLFFADPDGLRLEITAGADEAGSVQLPLGLTAFDHVSARSRNPERTRTFMESIMGMDSQDDVAHFEAGSSEIVYGGGWITYKQQADSDVGVVGIGSVHHVAFAVKDEEEQLRWRNSLIENGVSVTGVVNRIYFRSIYFREPSGVLFEIATIPPGFTVDERLNELGSVLRLPSWLEPARKEILAALPPIAQ